MHAITSTAGHVIGNEFKISTVAKLSIWRMIAMIVGSTYTTAITVSSSTRKVASGSLHSPSLRQGTALPGRAGLSQPVSILGGPAGISHPQPVERQAGPPPVLPGQHRNQVDVVGRTLPKTLKSLKV